MRFRVVDIETVPDLSVWTPGIPRWRWIPGEPVTVRRVYSEGAKDVGESAFHPLLEHEALFPPPQAHRVVAIATLDIGWELEPKERQPKYRYLSCESSCRWSHDPVTSAVVEMVLLKKFADGMMADDEVVNLVTWNGRGFDLPVMSMRALHLGVPWGWYYEHKDLRYRYSAEGHLDLMDFLADFGAAKNMNLGDAARLIGLPGKVLSVSGATVHDEFKSTISHPEEATSRMEAVRRYCLADAIQTAIIFLRTRYHLGKLTATEYNSCLESFRNSDSINMVLEIDFDGLKL